MGWLLVLLLAAPDEPEPGLLPIKTIRVSEMTLAPVKGNAETALKTFIAAHAAHKRKEIHAALTGYVRFLGMPGRLDLPARYLTTVRRRVDAMRKQVRLLYDKALQLYAKDRAKGLAALYTVAKRYPLLPEGVAAKKMAHSDGLADAIAKGRGTKDKKAAAVALEKAIRQYTAAVFRYEAKKLLMELGGPDLFDPGEKILDEDEDD